MLVYILIYVTLSIFILFLSMWIKSTNLLLNPLNNKHYQCNYFTPIKICYFDSDYQLLDILSKLYQNCVFEITYIRVSIPGIHLKYYGIRAFKLIIILILFQIFKFLIQGIKFIFSNKKLTFFEFLYLNYDNYFDERKLMVIDNTWHYNNNPNANLFKFLKYFENLDKLNSIEKTLYIELRLKFNDLFSDFNPCPNFITSEILEHTFIDKKFKHTLIENQLINVDYKWSYITDAHKAFENDFYNSRPTLPLYTGINKASTLIPYIKIKDKKYDISPHKITYESYSFDIFKNKILIPEDTPNIHLYSIKNYNGYINDDIFIFEKKWDYLSENTKGINLTNEELLELFIRIYKNIP